MAKPKMHKLKAITTYEDYIGLCGKTVRKLSTTQNKHEVTCQKCLNVLNQG